MTKQPAKTHPPLTPAQAKELFEQHGPMLREYMERMRHPNTLRGKKQAPRDAMQVQRKRYNKPAVAK